MLTREQIVRKAVCKPPVPKEISELGGQIFVKQMPAGERIDWELAYMGKGTPDMREYTLGLIARTVVDAGGKSIFTLDDVASWSRDAVKEVGEACADVNGIGVKAVADAEGKSVPTLAPDGDGNSPGASGTSTQT